MWRTTTQQSMKSKRKTSIYVHKEMHFLELIIQTICVIWRRYKNFEVYLFTLKIKIVNHLFGLLELKFSFSFV